MIVRATVSATITNSAPPSAAAGMLILLSLLLVPVAVAVGVLRYRLLGIEAVLRRGLVYGMYTCVVVAVYLAVTAAAGAAVGAALDSRPLPGVWPRTAVSCWPSSTTPNQTSS